MKRFILGCVLAAFIPLLCQVTVLAQDSHPRPNIILINLDDASTEFLERLDADVHFPNMRDMVRKGISFTNMHATTPLCGPSRACLYRGQYSHRTGILSNDSKGSRSNGFTGGFEAYKGQNFLENDLSTWMKDRDYRTMLVGKYLHEGFNGFTIPTGPFPGWDDLHVSLGNLYYDTHQYSYRTDDQGSQMGDGNFQAAFRNRGDRFAEIPPNVYRTTHEEKQAVELLRLHAARNNGQPFFLNINPFGPHSGRYITGPAAAQVAEINMGAGGQMVDRNMNTQFMFDQLPSPAFNEEDATFLDSPGNFGKVGGFSGLPFLENETIGSPTPSPNGYFGRLYRKRMLALISVDRLVGAIQAEVEDLSNTYIILTSDNGFSMGHNRFHGKGAPTNRCTNIPCVVTGPTINAPLEDDRLLGHIDFAPTIVELAGGVAPGFVDGMSFAAKIKNPGDTSAPVRTSLLIQNWEQVNSRGTINDFAGTSVKMEIGGENIVFTQWANGDKDWYDLGNPSDIAGHIRFLRQQTRNRYPGISQMQEDLATAELRRIWELEPLTPNAVVGFPFPYDEDRNPVIPVVNLDSGEQLSGFAVASQRVEAVELQIHHALGYWNGFQWVGDSSTTVSPTFNSGLFNSKWEYSFCPGAELTGVKVKARVKPMNETSFSAYSSETEFDTIGIGVLLGDADQNGMVDFADIPAFIDILIAGSYIPEVDIDKNGVAEFADIPLFIDILIAQ